MLSREEIGERLVNGPANDYMKLAKTARQLAEWLETAVECCEAAGCFPSDNPCLMAGECSVPAAHAWLEGR